MMSQATVQNAVWTLDRIQPYELNAKIHSSDQLEQIKASIRQFGFTSPLVVTDGGDLIAGHGRLQALKELGWNEAAVRIVSGLSDADVRKIRLADNKIAENAIYSDELLQREIAALVDLGEDMEITGFSSAELEDILAFDPLGGGDGEAKPGASKDSGALARRFGVPPFSVLSARDGWWQERKRSWLGIGIESELGRRDDLTYGVETFDPYRVKQGTRTEDSGTGTSVFDPVLCELAYRWFCPEGGTVLDPFAGGSVRGVVAAKTGRKYVGVDLRAEQVNANRAQWEQIGRADENVPQWRQGDSRNIEDIAADTEADMIFSCPPYADLEVYSDDQADLSTLGYEEFRAAYREIIAASVAKLKEDRFACFVVGDVRDKRGAYRNFVGDTVEAFVAAGMSFYNEAILVTAIGTLPIRAGRAFSATRKLGKAHQNVLVFVKGDPKRATEVIGEVEFGDGGEPDAV